MKENGRKFAQVPTEGKWFQVNPFGIDQNLFKERRDDSRQDATRQLILAAFEELKKNSKYAKPFKVIMPEKTWSSKTVRELKELAKNLGDHNANLVEWSLMLAQQIANGESWGNLCNKADKANWYRLIVWEKGTSLLVGGSGKNNISNPAAGVHMHYYDDHNLIKNTVPLVVAYDD